MTEIYLLEQLDAFARCGTLSAASEELHVSQPALTRSMKKIEEVLGVELFERHKNRLYLNDNGKLAAELAARILQADRDFEKRIRDYDRSKRTISFGCCAPVPNLEFTPRLQQLYSDLTIQTEQRPDEDELYTGLERGTYQLIVSHICPEDREGPDTKDLFWQSCGHETLCVTVPPASPLAAFDSITFADLEDVPILQQTRVGFWADIVLKKIPHPNILLQNTEKAFLEIRTASALPSFHSDYFKGSQRDEDMHRKIIPISDPEATVTYYLIMKSSDKSRFRALLSNLPEWSKR